MSLVTAATTLSSLAKIREYLAVDNDTADARLVQIADAVTDRIESYASRSFVTRAFTDVFDGDGSGLLLLRNYPVVAISALSVRDGVGATPTAYVSGTDYDADLRLARVQLRSASFVKGFQNVTATYTAGFGAQDAAALPQDVVQAALDYVKLVWTELTTNGISATSISVGPSSMVLKPGMPWGIKQVLDGWKRRRLS